MKGKFKMPWRAIAVVLVSVLILYLLQRLLIPKYADKVVEGAFIADYYKQDKDFVVVFLGDCEVYENFSPITLWEEYGINSYIRGSAEQYIWQSYYLLEDTLRYRKPDVVIFNIQSLQFSESQNEAYNRMSIEGMRWSSSKVGAINASMTEDEHFIEYVFPILRYHTRWSELSSSDVKYWLKNKDAVSHNGYFMRVDVRPVENLPRVRPLGDYSFGDNAWLYLDKMVELCKKENIELLLIKAPSVYPHWYDEWDEQVKAYAAEHELKYINFLEHVDEIGIDYSTDTYDGGLHLNLSGAEKCAHYIGAVLKDEYKVPDRRGESKLDGIWQEKIKAYRDEIERQKKLYGIAEES